MGADSRPILIAGAGIAGLTAAVALARAGLAVTLIERATRFEEIGAGLQLSPNASRVLIALGLGPALERAAAAPAALIVRRFRREGPIARMPMNEAAENFGAPFWTALRADLQTVLIDAARADPRVTLLVGRTVERFRETARGVVATVAAARGEEEIEGAALIGADGLRSRVRALIGEATPPRFSGCEAWRALLPAREAPAFAREAIANLWLGRGAHLVHYPVAGGRFVNLVLTRETKDRRANAGWNALGAPEEIAPIMKAIAAPGRGLLTSVKDWRVWPLFDAPPLKSWTKSRVALIGDAAHPVLPFLAQGAALSIEDAAVLAQEAAYRPDDLATALARFEKRRRARATRVQRSSRANARAYHASGPAAFVRDCILAGLDGAPMLARYRWLYGWTPDS